MTAHGCCPPAHLFEALLQGKLSAEQEDALAGHLDSCRSCQQLLDSQGGTGMDDWRIDATHELAPLPEPLRQAMHNLKASSAQLLTSTDILGARPLPPALLWVPPQEGWLGPYEVRGVIGSGGMGVVLEAFDPALGRTVAIKVLAPHLASCPAARRRFAREGRAAAAVRHEHVVAIHAVHEADGLPYLVMEYVPGTSLQERLDRQGPLDARSVLRIAIQAAWGLAAAHAQGLVHRDVKPANILLENGVERVKITDFGLARAVDDARLTQSGMIAGTPEYMAPEQARGKPIDHRADLFSLGSVLYAMLTGRTPFHAATPLAVLQRVCADKPAAVRQLNPAVDLWLAKVVAILHAKEPAQRFGSAAELAILLGQYLTHLEQPAAQPKPPRLGRRLWLHGRRLQRLTLLAGAGLLLAVGLLSPWPDSPALFRTSFSPGLLPANGLSTGGPVSSLHLRARLPHPKPVIQAAFSPSGRLLATACQDHKVRLWDYHRLRVWRILSDHRASVWSVAFSPDGQTLATAAGEWEGRTSGELFLWDTATGALRRVLSEGGPTLLNVAFSSDGHLLASAGMDGVVCLWDPATGKMLRRLNGHGGTVRFLAFSPDGSRLASGSFDGSVKLWDSRSGKCLATLQTEQAWGVNAVAFSRKDSLLAVAELPTGNGAAPRGRISLWRLDSRDSSIILEATDGGMLGVQFSPDGKILAAAGGNWEHCGGVCLWDTSTWGRPFQLPGYSAWVEGVSFSPDNRLLATVGGTREQRGELKLWDCSGTLPTPPAPLLQPAFPPPAGVSVTSPGS